MANAPDKRRERILELYGILGRSRDGQVMRRDLIDTAREAGWSRTQVESLREISNDVIEKDEFVAALLAPAATLPTSTAQFEAAIGKLELAVRWLRRAEAVISPARSSSPSQASPEGSSGRRANRRAQLEGIFALFDLDGSGSIESSELLELGKARRKLGHKTSEWSGAKNLRMMQRMDADGNGTVSAVEFVDHFERMLSERSDAEFQHEIELYTEAAKSRRASRPPVEAAGRSERILRRESPERRDLAHVAALEAKAKELEAKAKALEDATKQEERDRWDALEREARESKERAKDAETQLRSALRRVKDLEAKDHSRGEVERVMEQLRSERDASDAQLRRVEMELARGPEKYERKIAALEAEIRRLGDGYGPAMVKELQDKLLCREAKVHELEEMLEQSHTELETCIKEWALEQEHSQTLEKQLQQLRLQQPGQHGGPREDRGLEQLRATLRKEFERRIAKVEGENRALKATLPDRVPNEYASNNQTGPLSLASSKRKPQENRSIVSKMNEALVRTEQGLQELSSAERVVSPLGQSAPPSATGSDGIFESLDLNQDGVIDREEFSGLLDAIRAEGDAPDWVQSILCQLANTDAMNTEARSLLSKLANNRHR